MLEGFVHPKKHPKKFAVGSRFDTKYFNVQMTLMLLAPRSPQIPTPHTQLEKENPHLVRGKITDHGHGLQFWFAISIWVLQFTSFQFHFTSFHPNVYYKRVI